MSIYVPNGYRLAETAFREFITACFVQELKAVWDAYGHIQSEVSGSVLAVLGEDRDRPPFTMERWHRSIEDRYSGPCAPPATETPQLASAHIRRDMLKNLRTAEVIRRIGEDRSVGYEPSSTERCLELLEGGCWGYWERNRIDLATTFREEFIEGRRLAFAVAEDGSMPRIPAEWWRGAQCTDALMSQCFQHPAGNIVEKLLSPAEANDPHQRKLAAIDWLNDHGPEVAELPDDERRERFRADTGVIISKDGWTAAKVEFLSQRPDLKNSFTRSGPRRRIT